MAITTYILDTAGPAQVTPVYLLSGSVAVNLNPGDIHIGDVGIIDEVTGLKAQVEYADTPKGPTANTLLVQAVDLDGNVINKSLIDNIHEDVELIQSYQGVQIGQLNTIVQAGTDTLTEVTNVYNTAAAQYAATLAIKDTGTRIEGQLSNVVMNTENTVVAIDEQTVVLEAILNAQGTENLAPTNAILSVIMNGQGTLATHTDVSSVNATLGAGNALLGAILNNEGTLATHADSTALLSALGATNALLTALSNEQGTLVTQVTSASILSTLGAVNALLTSILNGQGTLATHSDAQAINSSVVTGNSTQTVIMNGQGTLATHTDATTIDTDVKAVTTAVQNFMYWQQSGSIYSPVMTLLNNQVGVGSSQIADVSGYMLHAVQINISGSAVVQMQSSLDANVWQTDSVMLHSQLVETSGKFKYVRVRTVNGGGTVSAFAIASR